MNADIICFPLYNVCLDTSVISAHSDPVTVFYLSFFFFFFLYLCLFYLAASKIRLTGLQTAITVVLDASA